MKFKNLALLLLFFWVYTINAEAQVASDSTTKQHQAKAPKTQPFGAEAFAVSNKTVVRWLGMAGFLVNSRGTTFMVDPLLEGYDMPLLMNFPITPKKVPHVDAIFATHSDNDHYSVETFKDLSSVTKEYHSTMYVDSLMKNEGLHSFGHGIGETFHFGPIQVKLTAADHAWQNSYPGTSNRFFKPEDACGFWFNTPDGSIWAPGDSRLMPEQLKLPIPDLILLDYSEDSEWHFGLEGSAKLINAYPNTPVLLGHWGFVDAPDFLPFNGDPERLKKMAVNPERIQVLAPGAPYTLKRLKKTDMIIPKSSVAQNQPHYMRIAKIVVDSSKLESYTQALKAQMKSALKLEPGVLAYSAVYDKNNPVNITIVETYASVAAYEKHIKTEHFKKYKATVADMVVSLELIDVIPIVQETKLKPTKK